MVGPAIYAYVRKQAMILGLQNLLATSLATYVRIVRNKRFGSEHDRPWESGSCESLPKRMAACGYTMGDGLMQQL